MTDIHARTSAAFLADAAERCANVGPGNQADCDAAIAAIEAGLDLGAPDPAPAAPLAPVAAPVTVAASAPVPVSAPVRAVRRPFIVLMSNVSDLTFTVRAMATSAEAATRAACEARPGCIVLRVTDCGPQA